MHIENKAFENYRQDPIIVDVEEIRFHEGGNGEAIHITELKETITAINSEVDYKAALTEIEQLLDRNVRAGTPEGDRLNLLTLVVQDYESASVA